MTIQFHFDTLARANALATAAPPKAVALLRGALERAYRAASVPAGLLD